MNTIEQIKAELKGKQIIIISENDGIANIKWDCRSLDDVKALLASAQSFITDKQVGELRGIGSGPDYNTTEGRFRNAHKFQQEPSLTVEKVVEQCKKFGGNPEVIQSEVDLEKEIEKYLVANFTNDEDVETPFLERRFAFWKDDLLRFAKHIAEWQKTKMMEGSFTTIMQTDDLGDRVPTLPDMA